MQLQRRVGERESGIAAKCNVERPPRLRRPTYRRALARMVASVGRAMRLTDLLNRNPMALIRGSARPNLSLGACTAANRGAGPYGSDSERAARVLDPLAARLLLIRPRDANARSATGRSHPRRRSFYTDEWSPGSRPARS